MSKTQFMPCDQCKDKPGPMPGYYYNDVEVNGHPFKTAVECNCHYEWMKENLILIQAPKNNLWNHTPFLGYNPALHYKGDKENIPKMANKFVAEFVANMKFNKNGFNQCLYFYGPQATQKTTVAQWIGLEILKTRFAVYYERMQELIPGLIPINFDDAGRARLYSEKCLKTDLLIIDNAFEKNRCTIQSFQLPYIDSFLRERIEIQRKSTILISGLPVDQIEFQGGSKSIQEFLKLHTDPILFTDNINRFDIDTSSIFGKSKAK